MGPNQEKPRLSNLQVEEKAAEARALLGNPVFIDAISDVYSEAIGTLVSAEVGSLTASTAHASMKAITALRAKLEGYVADHQMRQKYSKGDK